MTIVENWHQKENQNPSLEETMTHVSQVEVMFY